MGIQSEQKTLAEHWARGYDYRVVRRQTDAERIDAKKTHTRQLTVENGGNTVWLWRRKKKQRMC